MAQPLAGISSIPPEFPNARPRKKSNESKEWSVVGLAECCRDETSDVEGVNMPSFQPLKRPLKQLVYRFICMIHDQKSSIWFIFRFKDTMFVWSRDKCPYSTWDSSSIILHELHEFAVNCRTQLQFGRVPIKTTATVPTRNILTRKKNNRFFLMRFSEPPFVPWRVKLNLGNCHGSHDHHFGVNWPSSGGPNCGER